MASPPYYINVKIEYSQYQKVLELKVSMAAMVRRGLDLAIAELEEKKE